MSLVLGSNLVANTIVPIIAGVLVATIWNIEEFIICYGSIIPRTS